MLIVSVIVVVLIVAAIAWQIYTVDDAGDDNHYTHYK